jgi:hypothetical protein
MKDAGYKHGVLRSKTPFSSPQGLRPAGALKSLAAFIARLAKWIDDWIVKNPLKGGAHFL